MNYTLILGNKNYSSWSMRAWLLLRFLDLKFKEININLYTKTSRAEVKALGVQTGKVPALQDNDIIIWDSLAIVEYLYESFPAIWPQERDKRVLARSFCCEIHSGLNALRSAMPVNIRERGIGVEITDAVRQDIERVAEIWNFCTSSYSGPWLMGDFCVLDIFYAPVATRFRTYNVKLEPATQDYCDKILHHPLVTEWCELSKQDQSTLDIFETEQTR